MPSSLPFAHGLPLMTVETTAPPPPRARRTLSLPLMIAVLALVLCAWQWFVTRQLVTEVQLEQTRKLAETGGVTQEMRASNAQTLQTVQQLAARVALNDSRDSDLAAQFSGLQTRYKDLSRDREDWIVTEIEHALTLTNQQLVLAYDVNGAINSLQMVNTQLASLDKAQFVPLRRAVAQDLARFKAFPVVDTVGLTVKLEQLIGMLDALPLAVDHRQEDAAPSAAAKTPVVANTWQRLLHELLDEFSQLIRVRRLDQPDVVLLTPEQGLFLRENIKLRLLNARIALSQRDYTTFTADLTAATRYVDHYFDRQAVPVQHWLAQEKEVAAAPVTQAIPTLDASLTAARALQRGTS